MKKARLIAALMITAALITAFTSCSKGENVLPSIDGRAEKDTYDYVINKSENAPSSDEEYGQKLVVNATIECETKDFDAAVSAIKQKTAELGGYISYSNVYQSKVRRAEFTVRIPTEKTADFDETVAESTSVLRKSSNISDITESYYSVKASYESLLIQEERLLAMLEKAEDLKDMLLIEDHLAEVRGKIESYETTLKTYDNKVAYSTIQLYICEVSTYTEIEEPSFGQRIKNAFVNSWEDFADGTQDFAVWFVEAMPTLIVLALLVVVIILIIKGAKGRKKKKEELVRQKIASDYRERQAKENGTKQD